MNANAHDCRTRAVRAHAGTATIRPPLPISNSHSERTSSPRPRASINRSANTALPAPPQTTLADDAARRKERAWRKFYQPPSICSEDRRGEFLVECANHSIRARKEFEERYATGRL